MLRTLAILKSQLYKCRLIITNGYTRHTSSGLPWLNSFCAEILQFSTALHKFLGKDVDSSLVLECPELMDITFLCLTQIITCIKHMERTIRAEEVERTSINKSRQHFVERIVYCLERLHCTLHEMTRRDKRPARFEDNTYVQLMDLLLDYLSPYCSYMEDTDSTMNESIRNDASFGSGQIRLVVNVVIGHALSLANVALDQDGTPLTAICQKVLRECIAFQNECDLDLDRRNDSNRKVHAISLENALYQLEDYLNESLLRLLYTCFNDFHKYSMETMRLTIQGAESEDELDGIIADFDCNVDRIVQVGIFTIGFASTTKMKNTVRSCLASLEALDSNIIAALYCKHPDDLHSEILEEHFDEEVIAFRNAIQEIVDSHAFAACYHDMVRQCISRNEKSYNKAELQELLDMGVLLCQHFELDCNLAELESDENRVLRHNKFMQIFRECRAILICSDQVANSRVLKRFKILRSMLRKFVESLMEKKSKSKARDEDDLPPMFCTYEMPSESQPKLSFDSFGISASAHSILYKPSTGPHTYSLLPSGESPETSILGQLLSSPSVAEPLRQVDVPQMNATTPSNFAPMYDDTFRKVPNDTSSEANAAAIAPRSAAAYAPLSAAAYAPLSAAAYAPLSAAASIPMSAAASAALSAASYSAAYSVAYGLTSGAPYGIPSGPVYGATSSHTFNPAIGQAYSACDPTYVIPVNPAFGIQSDPAYVGPSISTYCPPSGSAYGMPSGSAFDLPSGSAYDLPSGSAYDPAYVGPSISAYCPPSGPAYGMPIGPAYGMPSGLAYGMPSGSAYGMPSVPHYGKPAHITLQEILYEISSNPPYSVLSIPQGSTSSGAASGSKSDAANGSISDAASGSKSAATSDSKETDSTISLTSGAASISASDSKNSAASSSKSGAASGSKKNAANDSKICAESGAASGSTSSASKSSAANSALAHARSSNDASCLERRGSMRRKPSLRTAMFKKQKASEPTPPVFDEFKNTSADQHIGEIVDQLTSFTSVFGDVSQHDKSFAK